MKSKTPFIYKDVKNMAKQAEQQVTNYLKHAIVGSFPAKLRNKIIQKDKTINHIKALKTSYTANLFALPFLGLTSPYLTGLTSFDDPRGLLIGMFPAMIAAGYAVIERPIREQYQSLAIAEFVKGSLLGNIVAGPIIINQAIKQYVSKIKNQQVESQNNNL